MTYYYPYGGRGTTSEVLRKILVAGAAIAALSVVACKKHEADGAKSLTEDAGPSYDVNDDTREG